MGTKGQKTPGFGAEGRETRVDRGVVSRPAHEISVEHARTLDRLCTEEFGIPSIVLMENAARSLLDAALRMLGGPGRRDCWVVAGPGNNGGDGLALARHLIGAGVETRVIMTDPDTEPARDAGTNLRTLRAMEVEIGGIEGLDEEQSPVLVVDCVFGTGLSRAPGGAARDAIVGINRARERGSLILSCDLPSGLDATSGSALDPDACVRAHRTVTFVAPKPGMSRIDAQGFIGEIEIGSIGAPIGLIERLCTRIGGAPDRGS